MIYLDHAATTPVPKAVADAMYTVLTEQYANPNAQYPFGQEMRRSVEDWRAVIAKAVGCEANQLFFTSCGTEGDNWAIRAACWQNRHVGRHIVTTAVEHHAVLNCCQQLEQEGWEVTDHPAGSERRHFRRGRSGGGAAGHGAGVRDDGEQRAGQHLSHCRHRQGSEGRQRKNPAPHRRGPRLFEGPLLCQSSGSGLHRHLRSQGRRPQGHRRSLYRPPGSESPAPAARRRSGDGPALRYGGHCPDRGFRQSGGAALGPSGGQAPAHGRGQGLRRGKADRHSGPPDHR